MRNEPNATILLVEEDDETRPLLKRHLTGIDYHVVVSLDEEDALERVSGARLHPDLIVLDEVGVPLDEAVNAARRIRREAELDKSVPIVVMAEKYGEEMAGKDVQVGEHEYITYLEDGQQLERLLTRLAPPHA